METHFQMPGLTTLCRNSPHAKVVCTYVTEEVRFNDWDASAAVRSLFQCGTTAGHMSPGSEPEALEQAADLRCLSWGGQDLNLRPTDYESAALTD